MLLSLDYRNLFTDPRLIDNIRDFKGEISEASRRLFKPIEYNLTTSREEFPSVIADLYTRANVLGDLALSPASRALLRDAVEHMIDNAVRRVQAGEKLPPFTEPADFAQRLARP